MMSPSQARPPGLDSKIPYAARTLSAYLDYLAQNNKVEAIAHLKIMIDARKILEQDNIKNDFPLLNFYCDWIVHSIITRSIHMLSDITAIFLKHWTSSDASQISTEVSEALNLKMLRDQLVSLMKKYAIGTSQILDDKIWEFLRANIIKELMKSPISLNYNCIFDKNGNIDYKKVCELIKIEAPFRVVRFTLVEQPNNGNFIINWKARIESPGHTTNRECYSELVGPMLLL